MALPKIPQTYRVLAKQRSGEAEREVYRTSDDENASCFAESFFINQHCQSVRAIDALDRPLRDRNGRDFVWNRVA